MKSLGYIHIQKDLEMAMMWRALVLNTSSGKQLGWVLFHAWFCWWSTCMQESAVFIAICVVTRTNILLWFKVLSRWSLSGNDFLLFQFPIFRNLQFSFELYVTIWSLSTLKHLDSYILMLPCLVIFHQIKMYNFIFVYLRGCFGVADKVSLMKWRRNSLR